jgi:hypothetical protein
MIATKELKMTAPDPLSLHACRALSAREAASILADKALRRDCEAAGVNMAGVVHTLRLRVADRVRQNESEEVGANLMTLLDQLTRRKIRFVVIGGLASRIYGSSHTTSDMDICHARDSENLDRLAEMLSDISAEFRRMPQFAPAALCASTLCTETDFVFNTILGKFDLIGEFTGVGTYEVASEDAITMNIARRQVPILSLPKLIAAKKSTGRPKDTLVYTELEIVRRLYETFDRAESAALQSVGARD